MDTQDNEYILQPDAPEQEETLPEQEIIQKEEIGEEKSQESVYVRPAEIAEKKKPCKKKRGRWLMLLLTVIGCTITAVVVTAVWQKKLNRMEAALDEKFAVLTQQSQENSANTPTQQLPQQGPLTPGQVYAKNVDAVVAVAAAYESTEGLAEGTGSGFIISSDGYVVTNYHVIEGAKQVTVLSHSGEEMVAKIVGSDKNNDVAVLKVERENLPCVTLGSSDALSVGDQVAAIGNPLGELTATMTVGYISAKDRIVNTDGTVYNMLQTDAAINSGNSGGPLFNMNGEVVGITTAKYSGNSAGASIEGLGFALPMDDVKDIISDLREYGYVTGAYLGVYVRDVDSYGQSYGLPAGAYVDDVVKGFCAEKAGIRQGDIIVNLGGYDVDSVTTLTRVLRRFNAGETATVTVYRNGNKQYLSVTFDEKPQETQNTTPAETTPVPDYGNNDNYNPFEDWFDFFTPFF